MNNTNVATMPKKNNSLIAKFASKFSVNENEVMDILKNTAFKQRDGQPTATDNQMTALMIVSDQYGLNPFTKEIYAYPDKSNGIVPVVGVDGWSRIINEHPQLDGIEFNYSQETVTHKGKNCHVWIECVITRKDRSKPIVVREFFDEVVRSLNFATPWDSHPKRMHRHKTLIQGARVAFGFAGIYDDDEAERIIEKDITPQKETSSATQPAEAQILDDATFKTIADKYKENVASGKKTIEGFIAWVESKGALMTDNQKAEVKTWVKAPPVTVEGEATTVDDPFVTDMQTAESESK
jgi:phage recombination protein Bet